MDFEIILSPVYRHFRLKNSEFTFETNPGLHLPQHCRPSCLTHLHLPWAHRLIVLVERHSGSLHCYFWL